MDRVLHNAYKCLSNLFLLHVDRLGRFLWIAFMDFKGEGNPKKQKTKNEKIESCNEILPKYSCYIPPR
jgi:hypothetical protein